MRKILFFLAMLLALMASCSQDDLDSGQGANTLKNAKPRFNGVKIIEQGLQTRGVADNNKVWSITPDPNLYIKFINQPSDPALIEKVKTYAKEWEQYAGIKFNFVDDASKPTDIRIAFDWNDIEYITWSYTGNDARLETDQNKPTTVFGGLDELGEEELKGEVLRVFGQILGLEFEQRHSDWDESWWRKDSKGVYNVQTYWEAYFADYDLDWEQIRQHVFDPLSSLRTLQTDQIDTQSIMMWPLYLNKQVGNSAVRVANYELSEGDKAFIEKLYPKPANILPTIQEAWVDPGYMVWRTKANSPEIEWEEGMVALKITRLGAQQEYLPDVRDGEQLNFGYKMFCYLTYEYVTPSYSKAILSPTKLKKAPKFNASNITRFGYMFAGNLNLVEVGDYLDTSKGTDFHNMFHNCVSLQVKPQLDLTNATNTTDMFYGTPFK